MSDSHSEEQIARSAVIYYGEHERIPAIELASGETLTGENASRHIYMDFARVLNESGLSPAETVADYNRTNTRRTAINPASPHQPNQKDHADGVTTLFQMEGLPIEPFSHDMSRALMLPRYVPDDLLGDDGPATV